MTLSNAVKARIKQLLIDKNLTVNRLATLSGIGESTIRNILSSEGETPKTQTLYYICRGFNMTLGDFFICDLFSPENISDD